MHTRVHTLSHQQALAFIVNARFYFMQKYTVTKKYMYVYISLFIYINKWLRLLSLWGDDNEFVIVMTYPCSKINRRVSNLSLTLNLYDFIESTVNMYGRQPLPVYFLNCGICVYFDHKKRNLKVE